MQDLKEFVTGFLFWIAFLGCILLGIYTVVCFLCGEVIPLSVIWP